MSLRSTVSKTCSTLLQGQELRVVEDESGVVHVYDLPAWPNKATELLRLFKPQASVTVMASSASLTGLVVLITDAPLPPSYRYRQLLALLGLVLACALACYMHREAVHVCLMRHLEL